MLLTGTLGEECDGTGPGGQPGSSGAGSFQIPAFPKGEGLEGQESRAVPIPKRLLPAPLLPAATPTLSLSAQQLLEAAF